MASKPLISIVTVTLNCASDAILTAKSVLAQDFPSYEYIVKDGRSTDGTVEHMQGLGINVHVQKDSGIYDAMNQSLDLCHGDYIYFLNAGDTLYSSNIITSFFSLVSSQSPILYGDICLMPMSKIRKYPDRLSRFYLFRKNINHQAVVIKRECFHKFGKFDTQYRYIADQALIWSLLIRYGQFSSHIPVPLANFVYGGFSTNREASKFVSRERWQLIKQLYSPGEYIFYWLINLNFLIPLKNYVWYSLHRKIL